MVALLVVFALTRIVVAWLADHPDIYGGQLGVTGDATLYHAWAQAVLGDHRMPYSDFRVEYPPGALGLALVPGLSPLSYRTSLILLMLLFDCAALVALVRRGRRGGSNLGPWLWTLGVPLLGPIAYVRLDLAAAAATIWAIDAMALRRYGLAGGLLGLAAAVKIYPVLLVLPALVVVRARRRFLSAVLLFGAVTIVPFATSLPAVARNVIGFHSGRGIEVESIWGAALLGAARVSHASVLEFSSESLNIRTSLEALIKVCAVLLAAGSALVICLSTARAGEPFARSRLPDAWFALVTMVVAVATVLSPQYLLWVLALGAAAACQQRSVVRRPATIVLVVCGATQALYPFLFRSLASGGGTALAVLLARDVLLLACGLSAVLAVVRGAVKVPDG